MATNSEKIDALTRTVTALEVNAESTQRQLTALSEDAETRAAASDERYEQLRARVEDLVTQLAVLREQLVAQRQSRDAWLNRLWTLLMVIAAGVVGYYLKR